MKALLACLLMGCAHYGDAVEAGCVKFQISALQAEAMSDIPPRRSPGYCLGNTYTDKSGKRHEGTAWCKPQEGDRVLRASCSSALKILKTGD